MSDSSQRSPREQQLDALIAEFYQAVERGRSPGPAEFIAEHPDFAAELQEFFGDMGRIQRAAQLPDPHLEPTQDAARPPGQPLVRGSLVRYFGDYEILEELGAGGMGVVYKARQVKLQRIVALKMIKFGRLASEAEVRRFESEARAAARLSHPGIVAVHEVGIQDGQHFFTMDYVAGGSLSKLHRDEPVAARRAAEVVRQLAEAIHYAHEQGIVHRDLKPANVLLTTSGQPRITDFGLAKHLWAEEGPDAVSITETGQIIGTAGYMSPEQAAGKSRLVGPPADIYALGAILYALLTSRAPFVGESQADTILQVLHREPVSPKVLNPSVSRDLETICLKCLEKEPHKRYGTAQLLADDLTRFVENRPVLARPVSGLERGWRWCRRNPWAATALALVVLVAVVSPPVAFAMKRLADEKDALIVQLNAAIAKANQETTRANDNAALAKTKAADAETRRQQVEQIADFQAQMLYDIQPEQMGLALLREIGRELEKPRKSEDAAPDAATLAAVRREIMRVNMTDVARRSLGDQVLLPAERVVKQRFSKQPQVQVRLLRTIAQAYLDMALHDEADKLLDETLAIARKELGETDEELVWLVGRQGLLRQEQGRFAEGEKLHAEALRRAEKAGLEADPRFLSLLHNRGTALREAGMYGEAEIVLRDVVKRHAQQKPAMSIPAAQSLNSLGVLLQQRDQPVEAEKAYRQALAMHESLENDDVEQTTLLTTLGSLLVAQRRLDEAEPLLQEAYDRRVRLLGKDHLFTLYALNELANLRLGQKRIDEAKKLFDEDLERSQRTLGDSHPHTMTARNNVAHLLGEQGRLEDALRLLQQNLELERQTLGTKHPKTVVSLNNLGMVLMGMWRFAEGEPYLREAMEIREKSLGMEHDDTLLSAGNLGVLLRLYDKPKEARKYLQIAVDGFRKKYGPNDPRVRGLKAQLEKLPP